MKAVWNDKIIAESEDTVVVESNHYFPATSINKKYFQESSHRTVCSWKGEARYYSIVVNGQVNENAAWCYPNTKEKAKPIEGMVAFWRGVQVIE